MPDRNLQERIDGILSRLSIPVMIVERDLETQGMPREAAMSLSDGSASRIGKYLYLPVPKTQQLLKTSAEYPSGADVLLLASELISALVSTADQQTDNSFDVYRRIFRGELNGSELDALAHEHQVPSQMDRCVLLFHIVQTESERAYDLLRDITPLQENDILVDIDRHSVAMIKDLMEDNSQDELLQYAQALQETLMGETAHQMTIGIGRMRHTLEELRESYVEARRAIEVGRMFKPQESIYVFSHLILERFLMELPQDISAYYHSLLFNRRNQRLFNEEMLYTIDMFFKKDLNLSDTARQLYIHRNTLVYRLDKVQKQIGLDLRSFEDAVTFKILMELKKVSGDNSSRKS